MMLSVALNVMLRRAPYRNSDEEAAEALAAEAGMKEILSEQQIRSFVVR